MTTVRYRLDDKKAKYADANTSVEHVSQSKVQHVRIETSSIGIKIKKEMKTKYELIT